MLLHNLKVALRNILKYKVQTLGSILSLAIGDACHGAFVSAEFPHGFH